MDKTTQNSASPTVNPGFEQARLRALSSLTDPRLGIGTLGEKLLHRTLKLYYEPNEELHEIEHLGFVADVKNGQGITEIQTRAFDRLKEKLPAFLADCPVTVVYPVVKERRLIWLDPESGELTSPKKSPKRGRLSDLLVELSRIPELVGRDGLTFRVAVLKADEYRVLDGRGESKKKGATKINIIPTELLEEISISSSNGLAGLIPPLPDIFTAKEFSSACGLRGIRASVTLRFLLRLGLVKRIGKRANAYLYSRV